MSNLIAIRDHPKSRALFRGPVLDGFEQFYFYDNDIGHPVYHCGKRVDPPLLILSELAGFAPGLLMFANRLVAARFQVYLPWMFGPFGQRASLRNAMKLCVSREFANLSAGVSAPITTWLRALTAYISVNNENKNIGAIGMCLTGAFVIPLIIDPHVTTAVAAQPAVPLSLLHMLIGRGNDCVHELNISDSDIALARQRLSSGGAHLFACRFKADRICPAEKLARLQREFPIGLEVHEYGNEATRNTLNNRPHATFTKEYRLADKHANVQHPARQAHLDLLNFLNTHLRK